MSMPNFADDLCEAVKMKKSVLCVGLDPQLRYMPTHLIAEAVQKYGRTFEAMGWLFFEFNRWIIDAVCDIAVCVKPQMAFYERYGHYGVDAFEKTVKYAQLKKLLVIGDCKRGDGGDTADAYADGYLGKVPFFGSIEEPASLTLENPLSRVDCLTVNGYIGQDCVGRFIDVMKEDGTGIFVVTKTSFKPNSVVEQLVTASGRPVWQELASMVNEWGAGTEGPQSGLRNVGVVMGATYPEDAPKMREILPNSIFLIPGFGSQGGAAKEAVVGIRPDGFGGIVNTSRALTYAWCEKKGMYKCASEEFAAAARLKAVDDRNNLVAACREAGKWPF